MIQDEDTKKYREMLKLELDKNDPYHLMHDFQIEPYVMEKFIYDEKGFVFKRPVLVLQCTQKERHIWCPVLGISWSSTFSIHNAHWNKPEIAIQSEISKEFDRCMKELADIDKRTQDLHMPLDERNDYMKINRKIEEWLQNFEVVFDLSGPILQSLEGEQKILYMNPYSKFKK